MEQDDLWTQLFADETVNPGILGALQANIMAEVLAHPVDFQECRIIERRRRWGLILAGCVLMLGVALLGLFIWQREFLQQVGAVVLWPVTGLWAGSRVGRLMEEFAAKMDVLKQVTIGLRYFWGQYYELIAGVTIAFVLSGIRLPSMRQNPRSSE